MSAKHLLCFLIASVSVTTSAAVAQTLIRARHVIVRLRTAAVNAVRGLAKPCGVDRSSAEPSIDFFEFASARVTKRIPLPGNRLTGLALAPDETWLAYAQIDQSASDLMLIEGFH